MFLRYRNAATRKYVLMREYMGSYSAVITELFRKLFALAGALLMLGFLAGAIYSIFKFGISKAATS